MGRRYYINRTVGLTAAGDMIQIASPSDAVTKVCSIRVEQSSDYGDAAAEGLRLHVDRGTAGSGGTTLTPRPVEVGDPAYGGTVLAENTTPMSSNTVLIEGGMNIQAGWLWTPTEKFELVISPSGAVALILGTAPADSITFEITIEIEEIGG